MERRATISVVLIAVTVLFAASARGDVSDLLGRYFAEADETERRRIADAFAGITPETWADFSRLLHKSCRWPELEAGTHRFTTPGDDVVPPVEYVLRVPPGYDRHRSTGLALVIGIHGTGGSGQGFLAQIRHILGGVADEVLIACPDAPQKGPYRVGRAMVEYPRRLLADVRRRVNVNSDRVVLTGYSKGGYTAWNAAIFSPGDWAAVVPMAGWPLAEIAAPAHLDYLVNVLPVTIQHHWGENDIIEGQTVGINTFSREVAAEMKRLGAERYEPVEYPDEGHRLDLDHKRIRTVVKTARRRPFPTRFTVRVHHPWQGRAWYAHAVAGNEPKLSPPVLRVRSNDEVPQALRRHYRRLAMEVSARHEPNRNALGLSTRKVTRLRVDLCPQMLDFSQTLLVTWNGRVVLKERRSIDWFLLLETARRTRDFERFVGGRLDLGG